MKKGLKTILATAMAGGMALSGAACTNNKGGDTISYYVWGNNEDIALVREIVDGFEAAYPGTTVDLQVGAGSYYDNLKTFFAGGTEPDIFFMEGGIIEHFIKEGLLLNLQPYIENTADDGLPSFTEADLWQINDGYRYDSASKKFGEGDLYSVIKDWSPDLAVVYNKDFIDDFNGEKGYYTTQVKQKVQDELRNSTDYPERNFSNIQVVGKTLKEIVGYTAEDGGEYPSEKVPMSWAQYELMCRLLTVYNNQGGMSIYGSTLDNIALKHPLQYVQSLGSSIYSEDFRRINCSDSKVIESYRHFLNLQYGTLKSAVPYSSNTVGSGEGFKTDQIAVVEYGRWAFSSYDWYGKNYGLMPPPTKEGGGDPYACSVAISHAVSVNCENPDLAWKFIKYYMTVGAGITVDKGFNIPGNKTLAKTDFVAVEDAEKRKLNEWYTWLADYTHAFQFNPYIDDSRISSVFNTELSAMIKGEYTVQDTLQKIANKIDPMLKNEK